MTSPSFAVFMSSIFILLCFFTALPNYFFFGNHFREKLEKYHLAPKQPTAKITVSFSFILQN